MINVVIIAVIAVIAVFAIRNTVKRFGGDCGCGGSGGSSVIPVEPADKNAANYPFSALATINGMTCSNCEMRVKNALNSLDGVWAKKVSHKKNSAELLLKSKDSAEAIKAAVEKGGYGFEGLVYGS